MNKLKNIFKFGVKKKTESAKLVNVEFLGKKQNVLLYTPYGIQMNPADDNLALLLSDEGNEENMVAFITDIENRDDLDDGELAIGIPSSETRIIFKKDDSLEIIAKGDITVTNDGGSFSINNTTGQVDVNGNFTVDA